MSKIVIVGGGYAGALAAVRAARGGAEVTLVSEQAELIERIRLHERVARPGVLGPQLQTLVGPRVHVEIGRATGLDRVHKQVHIGARALPYDKVIVAIGARSSEPLEHLEAGAKLTIIGGGLSGIELAAELAEVGRAVRLVTRGAIGERFSEGAHAYALSALARLGVRVDEHSQADEGIQTTGFSGPACLQAWGLACAPDGRAVVDATLRAAPDVYVVGDAAALPGVAMGCKSAMPMGAHAADNALRSLNGEEERPFTWRHPGLCISLGRRDGIIQFVKADDTPERYLRGRLAAFLKEAVCRYTLASIAWERDGLLNYRWKGGRADDRPALSAAS